MTLSPEDIRQILRVIDESPYDELELDTGDFTLRLMRTANGGWQQQGFTTAPDKKPEVLASSSTASAAGEEAAPTEEGLRDVRSPMVGTFYRSPKPGAAPFVDTGSKVGEDTIIAIIEVMKLMNSIPAAVSGEVVEVHAGDATLVHKGQLLMRVRP